MSELQKHRKLIPLSQHLSKKLQSGDQQSIKSQLTLRDEPQSRV